MKKVLHITGSLARNGTETFIMNVYRAIDRERVQFDFLLSSPTEDGYEQEARSLGATIYRMTVPRTNLLGYFLGYWRFFRQHGAQYDAVHYSACSLTQLFPLVCARLCGIPVRVVHAHSSSTHGLHNRILHMLKRHIISHVATHFLACSPVAAEYFYPARVRRQSVLINNGVDWRLYGFRESVRKAMREELGVTDSYVVGHVGRLTAVKNQEYLIDVFATLQRQRKDAMLMLVGVGESEQQLRDKVLRLNLERHVMFLGQRTDVHRLLQAMDCFAFPSLYEGLPFALVEAQAAGLPVVASDNVAHEVDITGNVRFLPITISPDVWAEAVNVPFERKDTSHLIESEGYSIVQTAAKLCDIYDRQ